MTYTEMMTVTTHMLSQIEYYYQMKEENTFTFEDKYSFESISGIKKNNLDYYD